MLHIENLSAVKSLDKSAMESVRGGLFLRSSNQLVKASKSGSLKIIPAYLAYLAYMIS